MTKNGSNDLQLWYKQPAVEWEEALPIGNGRLGAMIFGEPLREHLQLNEDTIWTGKPNDYARKGAHRYFNKIRELIAEGKQKEAEDLAMEHFMGDPIRQKAYQPFCDLYVEFPTLDQDDVESYVRNLDLNTAISNVDFVAQGVKYHREYLASFPHQTIMGHYSADQDGKISFRATLGSAHSDITVTTDENGLVLQGEVEPDGVKFEARLIVTTDGGQLKIDSTSKPVSIQVKDANSATIKFVGASSFVNYQDISGNPTERCDQYLANLGDTSYETVKAAHISDYQVLFNTLSFDLGVKALDQPTDWRVANFDPEVDLQLMPLYLQYGRYLMIAGSRPGSAPLNLQGIWNDKLKPAWDSKFTCNINLEMNYWPVESGNLAECHQPLFDMLKVIHQTGSVVAKEHYNYRGWVLHHNIDIWGGTAPVNASNHGIWPTGGAWLCTHIWQHYLYNQDLDFLEEYYPIMRDSALFFVDFLVEDPKTGWLISTPSNSPEQGGLVAGPAMDHQIIRELFRNTIAASKVLNLDADLAAQLSEMLPKIAPDMIGEYGQLQEWIFDVDDRNNKHRHVSHLWAVFPGEEISPQVAPDLSEAAKKTLEFRGDLGTGWSMAWKINLWARLEDGDHAYKLVTNLIHEGTYPNLFDSHPPFQIDGNFGATSGLMMMLLQSHAGHIALLPALPTAWQQGNISGIKGVGGFTFDLSWDQGKLVSATVTSEFGNPLQIRYQEPIEVQDSQGNNVLVEMVKTNVYAFPTVEGESYQITIK